MGDSHTTILRPSFNGSLCIEGRGEHLTSYAGFTVLRELDERLGITRSLASSLVDPREPARTRHSFTEMLRTWLYSMAGCRATATAAAELRVDPALRFSASDRRGLGPLRNQEEILASQPTLSRFLSSLTSHENLLALQSGLFDSAVRSLRGIRKRRMQAVTLDIDSYPHEVFGKQIGAEYNKHYHTKCFHPLGVMLSETGHWLGLELRPGNVHTSEGAEDLLLPLIERSSKQIARVTHVRGDAGFVSAKFLETLDEMRIRFAFRLPKKGKRLDRLVEELAVRPPGRPPAKPRTWCHDLKYRAQSWETERRIILVVQEKPGELFLESFFIVTSFTREELSADEVLDYYRERGTMEGHIAEHQSVINGFLSSNNRPKRHIKGRKPKVRSTPIDAEGANAAALLLHGLSFNLLNTLRILSGRQRMVEEFPGLHLRRARQLLLATAGRIVVSARRATLIVSGHTAALWSRMWKALMRITPILVVP